MSAAPITVVCTVSAMSRTEYRYHARVTVSRAWAELEEFQSNVGRRRGEGGVRAIPRSVKRE